LGARAAPHSWAWAVPAGSHGQRIKVPEGELRAALTGGSGAHVGEGSIILLLPGEEPQPYEQRARRQLRHSSTRALRQAISHSGALTQAVRQ
jgi:hypothetical protein